MVATPRRQPDDEAVSFADAASAEGYEILLEGTDDLPPAYVLTDEQSHALFDRVARETLGKSGEEFVRRYDAGECDDIVDDTDHPGVMRMVALLSFGR